MPKIHDFVFHSGIYMDVDLKCLLTESKERCNK